MAKESIKTTLEGLEQSLVALDNIAIVANPSRTLAEVVESQINDKLRRAGSDIEVDLSARLKFGETDVERELGEAIKARTEGILGSTQAKIDAQVKERAKADSERLDFLTAEMNAERTVAAAIAKAAKKREMDIRQRYSVSMCSMLARRLSIGRLFAWGVLILDQQINRRADGRSWLAPGGQLVEAARHGREIRSTADALG